MLRNETKSENLHDVLTNAVAYVNVLMQHNSASIIFRKLLAESFKKPLLPTTKYFQLNDILLQVSWLMHFRFYIKMSNEMNF